jgi:hypothetical protein
MRRTNRRPPPPWQRGAQSGQPQVGRARRRFPPEHGGAEQGRMYDGTGDGGPRRRGGGGSLFDRLRRHPVKHGIIGMAVAGTAIPLAIQRQSDMRTDPSHETSLMPGFLPDVSESRVAGVWQEAATNEMDAKEAAREAKVEQVLERYAKYDLDRELAEDIYDLATEEGIDVDMAFGLVQAESDFMNSATSHVGAIGLTQLMPKTARWLDPNVTNRDLRDQRTNLRLGFKYLGDMLRKYDGNERLALLAYNRGPGTVDRVLKQGGNPDNGYVEMVRRGSP